MQEINAISIKTTKEFFIKPDKVVTKFIKKSKRPKITELLWRCWRYWEQLGVGTSPPWAPGPRPWWHCLGGFCLWIGLGPSSIPKLVTILTAKSTLPTEKIALRETGKAMELLPCWKRVPEVAVNIFRRKEKTSGKGRKRTATWEETGPWHTGVQGHCPCGQILKMKEGSQKIRPGVFNAEVALES